MQVKSLNQVKIILTVAKWGFQSWRSFFSIFSAEDERAGIALIQRLQALSETTAKHVQYGRNRCAQAAQSRQPTCNKHRYYATHAELPEGAGPISTATNNTSTDTYKSTEKGRINQSQSNIVKTNSRKSRWEFFDDVAEVPFNLKLLFIDHQAQRCWCTQHFSGFTDTEGLLSDLWETLVSEGCGARSMKGASLCCASSPLRTKRLWVCGSCRGWGAILEVHDKYYTSS